MEQNVLQKITTWWGAGLLLIGSGGITLLSFFTMEWHFLKHYGISQQTEWLVLSGLVAFLLTAITYFLATQLKQTTDAYLFLEYIPFPIIVMSPPPEFFNRKRSSPNTRNKVLFVNVAWERHFNRSRCKVLGKDVAYLRSIKPEIIAPPKRANHDDFYALLKEDWNRCFKELNDGRLRSVTTKPIPMKTQGGDGPIENHKFIYCAHRPNRHIRAIVIITVPDACNPPSLIGGTEFA